MRLNTQWLFDVDRALANELTYPSSYCDTVDVNRLLEAAHELAKQVDELDDARSEISDLKEQIEEMEVCARENFESMQKILSKLGIDHSSRVDVTGTIEALVEYVDELAELTKGLKK